jgi:hypothetical protein
MDVEVWYGLGTIGFGSFDLAVWVKKLSSKGLDSSALVAVVSLEYA